jgi:hypothetical protein
MTNGAPQKALAALEAGITELEADGGDHFQKVRVQFIKSMAERARRQDPVVAGIVASKALVALEAYRIDLSREHERVAAIVEEASACKTPAATPLSSLVHALEHRQVAGEESPSQDPLGELLQRQENEVLKSFAEAAGDAATPPAPPERELKSARYFRELGQQRTAESRIAHAAQEAPEDSGPLNPQKLAIRSLIVMRELSPSYLRRFVSYVDTLFWLENTGGIDK